MDVGDAEFRAEGHKARSIISESPQQLGSPIPAYPPKDIGVERLKLGSPLVAMNRHPVAQNRLPLYPGHFNRSTQHRTWEG
jgi:hypothetical protein